MKQLICIAFIFFQSLSYAQDSEYVSDELLIQLYPSSTWDTFVTSLQNENIHLIAFNQISSNAHIWKIQFSPLEISINQFIEKLKANRNILAVQPNHYMKMRGTIPDDPSFINQWDMFNDGIGGIDDADIDAELAWDITTGGTTINGDTIVIAIIDDGFDLNHIDLHFWKNKDEIEDNGIDDDGNGFIDDKNGWNVHENSDSIKPILHGTHVSGIAGAIGNNDIGVAGVNWNVQIMPVVSYSEESEVIEAYDYITTERKIYNATNGEQGTFVVSTNTSFGIDFGTPEEYPLWCAMYDTLGKVGILSAAATINGNYDVDSIGDIPTSCTSDYLITVTNTNKLDEVTSAGYGAISIDLGAPGSLIYSTYPDNDFDYLSGTSMATPHVAGAVALLLSAACEEFLEDYKTDPSVILKIKDYILDGTDSIAELNGVSVSGGRLNLFNALINLLDGSYCDNAVQDINSHTLPVNIFPNPSSEIIYFNFQETESKPLEFSLLITNILGQEIFSQNYNLVQLQNYGISVKDFAPGVYTILLSDITGKNKPVAIQCIIQ